MQMTGYNCQTLNKEQLLHYIDMVSFAAIEAQLYLDTHTCDETALDYFNQYEDMRRMALRTYAENYGPLTIDTANPDCKWDWALEPWPWEGGCY